MTTTVPHGELDKLKTERDQARGIAVGLEQENARLTAVIGHLMTNAMNVSEHEAWTCDLDALMAGSLDITEMGGWTALRFTSAARGGAR